MTHLRVVDDRSGARGAGSVIHLEGIRREYSLGSETVHALRDVSLTIDANEYVAIVGPSGSGKSTLMNIFSTSCTNRVRP